jgi:hypothetical protein
MLSPDGRHLVFPQEGSLTLYDVRTGEWSGFSTGTALTAYARWLDSDRVALPPSYSGGLAPVYRLDGTEDGQARVAAFEPAFDSGRSQSYGLPIASGGSIAQSWGMGTTLPIPSEGTGTYLSGPEFMAVRADAADVALVFLERYDDGDSRYKECCPVAGWLEPDTVVYESRSNALLVAWTIGTDEFALVSRIRGTYDVASFASLHE